MPRTHRSARYATQSAHKMASKRPTIGPAGPPKDDAKQNAATAAGGAQGVPAPAQRSAAFDAVLRMQLGQDCRTINDKINDSNRPTWDQYKKDNEDRLNLTGADQKKMMAYRAELDAERARKLARASKAHASLRDGSDVMMRRPILMIGRNGSGRRKSSSQCPSFICAPSRGGANSPIDIRAGKN